MVIGILFYPKQLWAEMGNGSEGDGGFHRGGSTPLPCEHRPGRLEQYLEIEPQRPVVDVLKIQIHPFLETHIVSTGGNLPQPG